MTIVELREKRAKLWATMEGFLDTHRDRKGVLSAEDDAVYAIMEKELNDLTNEVRRMERRDAIAAELAKPVSSPITEQPQKAFGEAKTGRAAATESSTGRSAKDRGRLEDDRRTDDSCFQTGTFAVRAKIQRRDWRADSLCGVSDSTWKALSR